MKKYTDGTAEQVASRVLFKRKLLLGLAYGVTLLIIISNLISFAFIASGYATMPETKYYLIVIFELLLIFLFVRVGNVAMRVNLSKISQCQCDYRKSAQIYEILTQKLNNAKDKNYYRLHLFICYMALGNYNGAFDVMNRINPKKLDSSMQYFFYENWESFYFRVKDYEKFEQAHKNTMIFRQTFKVSRNMSEVVVYMDKLYDARKSSIDNKYEVAKALYIEVIDYFKRYNGTAMNRVIATYSYELGVAALNASDKNEAYYRLRNAIEFGKEGIVEHESAVLLNQII